MTDRELLEMAAKAAGIEGRYASLDEFPDWMTVHDGEGVYYTTSQAWNPLTDDGDALRLAVKLKLEIYHAWAEVTHVCVGYPNVRKHRRDISYVLESYVEASIEDATRRAIVRAAAEIGRNMK